MKKICLLPILFMLLVSTYSKALGAIYMTTVLGITLNVSSDYPIITEVARGSQAEYNGVKVNDLLTSVNGKSTHYLTANELARIMPNVAGSQCNIETRRNNQYNNINIYTQEVPHQQQSTTQSWQPGAIDHTRHLKATDKPFTYIPASGYKYIDHSNMFDLRVKWQPGYINLEHKHLLAGLAEDTWIPEMGYTFVPGKKEVVWTPGTRYESLKIIAHEKERYFVPFPGYHFVHPDKNLDVAPNTAYSEGSAASSGNGFFNAVKEFFTSLIISLLFGSDNPVSQLILNDIMSKAIKFIFD